MRGVDLNILHKEREKIQKFFKDTTIKTWVQLEYINPTYEYLKLVNNE